MKPEGAGFMLGTCGCVKVRFGGLRMIGDHPRAPYSFALSLSNVSLSFKDEGLL
jgi:hypothetical protein